MTEFRNYSDKEKELLHSKEWSWRGAELHTCICAHCKFSHKDTGFLGMGGKGICKECTCEKFKWICDEND